MSTTVQVKLDPLGAWHRQRARTPGERDRFTACGLRIHGAFATREHTLAGELCSACFTVHERDTGEMKKIEARALEIAEADAFGDNDEHKTPIEPIFDDRTPPDGAKE